MPHAEVSRGQHQVMSALRSQRHYQTMHVSPADSHDGRPISCTSDLTDPGACRLEWRSAVGKRGQRVADLLPSAEAESAELRREH